MSRQAHLPPRCPFQKKAITHPIHDHNPPTVSSTIESFPRHHKSISQSYILEEKPAWLDDLLSDSDSNSKGIIHRRSASDSMTFMDGLVPLPSLTPLDDGEKQCSNEAGSGLESACVYGPNSPRGKLNFPDNAIMSALSEYVSQNHMQNVDGEGCVSRISQLDSAQDARGSAGEINPDIKAVNRHNGQRSRVRKLQYIAELERTVDVFQTLESELAVRVTSLLQQRVALSVENSKLKKQMARLQQEKQIVDGRYKSLRKEMERLKISVAYAPSSKVSTNFRSSHAAEAVSSEATWQMLNFGKLDLN